MKHLLLGITLLLASAIGCDAANLDLVKGHEMDPVLDRTGVMNGIVSEIAAYDLFGSCVVAEVRPVVFTAVYSARSVYEYALCEVAVELNDARDIQKAGAARQRYLILMCRDKYRMKSLWELRSRTGDYHSQYSHLGVMPLEKESTTPEALWDFLARWDVLGKHPKAPGEENAVLVCLKVYQEAYAQVLKGTEEKDFFTCLKTTLPETVLPK